MADFPQKLTDKPFMPFDNWGGYFHKKDKTTLPPNVLTSPSVNCFIPDSDRIVPRTGKEILGQVYTDNTGNTGHREKYTNIFGLEMEARSWASGDARGDVIEVLYTNPITSVTSWIPLTEATNPLALANPNPYGQITYYFDEWFDTELNGISLNLQRLVWVNGTEFIFSWTGGIAPIVSFVANTSITTTAGTTWAQQGFVDPAFGGSGNIVVNGTAYTITGGWGTDTLTLADTTGISANDVATAQIEVDNPVVDATFDMIRQNDNYCMFGNWKERNLYISNAFNKIATQDIIGAQAQQNDMTVTGSYTGANSPIYRVTIDSVNPDVDIQTFIPGGEGNQNDGQFDTSGYSGAAGVTNEYTVSVLANASLAVLTGTFPTFDGDTIQGATSGAEGVVVERIASVSLPGYDIIGVRMLTSVRFEQLETIKNLGDVVTTAPLAFVSDLNWIQLFKKGVGVVNIDTGFGGAFEVSPIPYNLSFTLTDGIDMQFGQGFGHAIGDSFNLQISQGGQDTYQVQVLGSAPFATNVAITSGAPTVLAGTGLSVTFVEQTGHALGDYWDIQANQAITRGWANFYYTLPVRKPGEGYIARLPSNFWTMAPQEKQMYVNTTHGQWLTVDTRLSAELTSESIIVESLKQTTANKALYPYLLGYLENDLTYVNVDKRLDIIGRRELLQLPQIGTLSEPVENDFLASSFINGSIAYQDKKLWITSPNDYIMHCFDNMKRYWQPPQSFVENGTLSIVGNKLITHSNLRNQSFTLFEGTTDDGSEYTVKVRTPYQSFGDKWQLKNSTMSFIEGYVEGNPPMTLSVLFGIEGCAGVNSRLVQPVQCIPDSSAPFGQGPLGSHGFGNDEFQTFPYFQEINKRFSPVQQYYLFAMDLECTSITQSWILLSMGLNATIATAGNNQLIGDKSIKIK